MTTLWGDVPPYRESLFFSTALTLRGDCHEPNPSKQPILVLRRASAHTRTSRKEILDKLKDTVIKYYINDFFLDKKYFNVLLFNSIKRLPSNTVSKCACMYHDFAHKFLIKY